MAKPLVLSYWNVNRPVTGGLRRVTALLEALGPGLVLCQPGPAHPVYETAVYRTNWTRSGGSGINRGLFHFFLPEPARVAREAWRRVQPGLIVHTSIWTFWPLRRAGTPMVLDAHDALGAAMTGRYGRHHPFTLLVRAWERRVARRMDRLFVCSDVDRAYFAREYGIPEDRLAVVPNGVRVRPPVERPLPAGWEERLAGRTVLFFMGKPAYQPNAQGLKFLCDTVLPELERRRPGRFCVVACGGEALPGLVHPALHFAGVVSDDDLEAFIRRADMCLSPTFSGSGTRLKILEWLAAGKAVLATPKGAEGLGAMPGRDLVEAEGRDFAEAIMSLADDPDRARALGRAGSDFVRQRYDWATTIQPLWREGMRRWLEPSQAG